MNINEYLATLKQAKLSPATIAAYTRELANFQRFARANRIRITQVKPSVITKYLAEMDRLRPSQGEAVRRRLTALSTFFTYLELSTDGRIRNPITPIRRPRRQSPRAKPVEDEVVEFLMAGITDERDKAILMTFLSSGLRLSELVSLDKDSISVETVRRGNSVQILGIGRVLGKGNKEREFYVDLPTLKQLRQYELQRGQDNVQALFISNRRRRMTPRAVQHMFRKWCRKLGLDPIHPHSLRHTAGTTWHRLGMGTLEISNLLGHASVATTELYIRPDNARLRAEYFASMEKLSPRSALASRTPDDPDRLP